MESTAQQVRCSAASHSFDPQTLKAQSPSLIRRQRRFSSSRKKVQARVSSARTTKQSSSVKTSSLAQSSWSYTLHRSRKTSYHTWIRSKLVLSCLETTRIVTTTTRVVTLHKVHTRTSREKGTMRLMQPYQVLSQLVSNQRCSARKLWHSVLSVGRLRQMSILESTLANHLGQGSLTQELSILRCSKGTLCSIQLHSSVDWATTQIKGIVNCKWAVKCSSEHLAKFSLC